MARSEGFEPPTYCSEDSRSNPLSYERIPQGTLKRPIGDLYHGYLTIFQLFFQDPLAIYAAVGL